MFDKQLAFTFSVLAVLWLMAWGAASLASHNLALMILGSVGLLGGAAIAAVVLGVDKLSDRIFGKGD